MRGSTLLLHLINSEATHSNPTPKRPSPIVDRRPHTFYRLAVTLVGYSSSSTLEDMFNLSTASITEKTRICKHKFAENVVQRIFLAMAPHASVTRRAYGPGWSPEIAARDP